MISFTLGGYTTSSDKMTILGSGNIGINQVSPTEKLHVVGDALITGDSHADAFKPAATGEPIKFKNFGSTEKVRITDGGNVLISTTTDNGYKLDVNGTGSFFGNIRSGGGTLWSDSNGGVQLGYNASDATGYLTTYFNTTSVVIGAGVSQKTGITINGQSASVGNKISFRVGDSERMRLTSDGRLGIGLTNPSTDLHIKSTSAGSGYATIENTVHFSKLDLKSSTQTGSIVMDGTGGFISGGGLLLNTTNNKIKFLEGGSASMILQSGNLAIGGTPGAVYKLDVVGKAKVQSVLELDDVLTLNQISTPADPASGQSSIYMDSADGAIKCKINVGGTVVTRTIASFE